MVEFCNFNNLNSTVETLVQDLAMSIIILGYSIAKNNVILVMQRSKRTREVITFFFARL